MSDEQEMSGTAALAEMVANIRGMPNGENALATMERHATTVIDQWRHTEEGKILLMYLSLKIVELAESESF